SSAESCSSSAGPLALRPPTAVSRGSTPDPRKHRSYGDLRRRYRALGHAADSVGIPLTAQAVAVALAGFPASAAGDRSPISARLIVAWRVGEVIFAPNRSVT